MQHNSVHLLAEKQTSACVRTFPMRFFLIFLSLFASVLPGCAQQVSPTTDEPTAVLQAALLGNWTGVLEYRDYSEPSTSTKRVQLPTWLTIKKAPEGIFFDYVYDDGPNKVVSEHHAVVIDLKQNTYKVMSTDAVAESYIVAGADKLKNGRGELILTGDGKDADKPAQIRTTWTIRRNLLSWLEEVRPAKSDAPFVFRHRYTFVRAETPTANAPE